MAPLLNEEESALDPYLVLGLKSDAADGDIKKAYRKLSLKYHPDKNSTEEGAIMFRKITVSLEILSDTSKRTYIDTRQAADRAKKERYAEMNKKKRVMVDALVAREEEAKKARVELAKKRQEENEEENIKEAGRKMLEKAQKRALDKAQAESRAASVKSSSGPSSSFAGSSTAGHTASTSTSASTSTLNGTGSSPKISAMDLTLVINIPATVPVDSLRQHIENQYGPLAHYILKDPQAADDAVNAEGKKKKPKGRKAIVEFAKGNWGGCWACWKDHQVKDSSAPSTSNRVGASLGEGVRAKWAGGEEPSWVGWATSQSTAQFTSRPTTATTNGQRTAGVYAGNGTTKHLNSNLNGNRNGNGHSHVNGNDNENSHNHSHIPTITPESTAFKSAPDFSSTTMADLLASHSRQKSDKEDKKRKEDEFESMTLLRMRRMEREKLEAQIRAEEGD